MTPQLGPLPCKQCRRSVLWIYYEGPDTGPQTRAGWWLGERLGTRLVSHRCER